MKNAPPHERIGFETAKQLAQLGQRLKKGTDAVNSLNEFGLTKVEALEIDVADIFSTVSSESGSVFMQTWNNSVPSPGGLGQPLRFKAFSRFSDLPTQQRTLRLGHPCDRRRADARQVRRREDRC